MTTETQDRRDGDEKGIIRYTVTNARGEEQQITLTTAIVRKFLCADADDTIANTFMGYCRSQSLDPFAKEIYLSVRKDQSGELRPQMTVAYQSFMKIAEASEYYKGFRAGTILQRLPDATIEVESEPDVAPKPLVACPGEFVPDGYKIVGGWCKVSRSDRPDSPIISTVNLSDYDTGMSTWKKIKATMIRKVAIAHCFRDGFPGRVGRVYIPEEMPATVEKKAVEVPTEDTPKIVIPPTLVLTFDALGWNQTQREMFVALRRNMAVDDMQSELNKEKPIQTVEVTPLAASGVSEAAPRVVASETPQREAHEVQPPVPPTDAAKLLDF